MAQRKIYDELQARTKDFCDDFDSEYKEYFERKVESSLPIQMKDVVLFELLLFKESIRPLTKT